MLAIYTVHFRAFNFYAFLLVCVRSRFNPWRPLCSCVRVKVKVPSTRFKRIYDPSIYTFVCVCVCVWSCVFAGFNVKIATGAVHLHNKGPHPTLCREVVRISTTTAAIAVVLLVALMQLTIATRDLPKTKFSI